MKINDIVESTNSKLAGAPPGIKIMTPQQFVASTGDMPAEEGVAEGSLNEFAQGNGGGDSGNYFRELASAWYTGAYNSGSLQKGIKTNKDIERLLQRGIVAPDGVTRKYNIDYNSDFDGVIIFSDDYYEHGDVDETDSRTGKPFGLYDYMEFSDDELSESLGQGVAEGDRPFRGVDGAFDRGDDEQHDLDPTDWYIVKDGEMFSASIYPRQVQQAIAQGFSRTRAEAKAKSQANSQTGSSEELEESQQESPMERPMLHRIMMRHMDLIEKYGIDLVLDSVRDVADSMNIGPDDEIGTSDVSAAMVNVMNQLNSLDQTIDEENIPAGNINASGSPTVSSGPTPVSAGGTAPVTQSSTAPAPAASTAPAAAGQQPPMTPEEQVALNKIKANAGLKTQYDRLIQQAH